MNIVAAYVMVKKANGVITKVSIAAELARTFDRPSYSHQLLNSWQRGDTPLPNKVYEHMLQTVLPDIGKLSKDAQKAAMSLPKRRARA